ncbi:hypothetical protein Tco_0070735, partial [Tanacetum coccineum]
MFFLLHLFIKPSGSLQVFLPSTCMNSGLLFPITSTASNSNPPFEEEILAFIRGLGYPRDIKSLSDVKVDTLYQPWRTFGTIINKCLSGKATVLDQLRLSRAQIIWGMYNQKKVDYVYHLWEDLVLQIKNKVSKKNKDMYYPRFTKVIINHFMSKDQSIPRKNKVDWHMASNDLILTTIRFIPKHETVQKYGVIIPDTLTNQAMKESEAYKTYHDFATGKVILKPKYVWRSTRKKIDQASIASPGKRLKATTKVAKLGKKKLPAQELENLSEIALSEAEQMKIVTKRSKIDFHSSYASGSGADEGTVVSPRVLDVPTYGSEDEHISWKSSDEDDDDEVTMSKDDEGEELDEEETNEEEDVNELYNDVNINLEGKDTEMTDALLANVQTTQVIEDTHVIITIVTPKVQQQSSSVSSGFISNMLNPNLDIGIDSILNLNTETTSLVDVPVTTNVEMPPSSVTTLPPPTIPLIQPLQQTPVPTPTIAPSSSLQNLPTFGSLFKYEDRVKALEDDFSEFKQTNLFTEAISSIPGIIDKYLANQMNEAIKAAVQLQSDRLRNKAQADNEDFINKIDENIKKIIKEQVNVQVKQQVSKILLRIKKSVNEQLKAEVLIRSSNKAKTSHALEANLSELELKKILMDKMENNKSTDISVQQKNLYKALDEDEEPSPGSNRGSKRRRVGKEPESTNAPKEKTSKSIGKSKEGSKSHQKSTDKSAQVEEPIYTVEDLEEPAHQEFNTGYTKDQPVDETTQFPNWFQKPAKPPTLDRDWNKSLTAAHGPIQPWINNLAQKENPRESFNEQMDTHLEFFAFVLNRLKVDTMTPELLAGPTFELMKVTKTKAADYGHIKWIEDLVLNTMWSQVLIVYDKHALWGISHWGRKHQKFYGFAVNMESARDITIRRNDDKLYTFKEGNYNRLRLQDIEDMLLLLVQGKLTNLNIEERLALVSHPAKAETRGVTSWISSQHNGVNNR